MSKAGKRALERYPFMADDDKEGLEALKYIGMECDCASEYNEVQEAKQTYFIEGYHQAEKDMDISWVKEVSGVKEMSREKEEALKAYPPRSISANYDTINRRDAFEYGYLKAEKDVAESFARIIRDNLSMIDKSVQDKFEQLYIDITGGKMYKGFID